MRGQAMVNRVTPIATVMLLATTGVSCGLQGAMSHQNATAVDAKLIDAKGRASLGVLVHRGTRYELRDLLDPTYRAASGDPYVRDLGPHSLLAADDEAPAVLWAGLERTVTVGRFSSTPLNAAPNRLGQPPWNP